MQVLSINGSTFRFADPEDLAATKMALASAVEAGGGYVDFTTATRVKVTVLVTPASTVRVEDRRNAIPELVAAATAEPAPSWYDEI